MLKKDLVKLIEKAKDDEDINTLLKGSDIETAFKGAEPTLETFKGLLSTDKDFKSYMDSVNDKYHQKALNTMKEKGTWESAFADEIKAKYPDFIKDPREKEMMELKNKIAEMEKKEARQTLLNQALEYAKDKKLPADIIEKCLGEDLDKTKAEIDAISTSWTKGLESLVDEKFKQSSYVPGMGGEGAKLSIGEQMAKVNSQPANNNVPDPWSTK